MRRALIVGALAAVIGIAVLGYVLTRDHEQAASFVGSRACFAAAAYVTKERADLGIAKPDGARDWYTVSTNGDEFLAVTEFANGDGAVRARQSLLLLGLAFGSAFGEKITDAQANTMLRTRGNLLYWWDSDTPIHLADVDRCMRTSAAEAAGYQAKADTIARARAKAKAVREAAAAAARAKAAAAAAAAKAAADAKWQRQLTAGGYFEVIDGLGYKWGKATGDDFEDTYYAYVVSRKGCTYLEVSVHFTKRGSDVVIGDDSDIASDVAPGQVTRLEFHDLDQTGYAKVATAQCSQF